MKRLFLICIYIFPALFLALSACSNLPVTSGASKYSYNTQYGRQTLSVNQENELCWINIEGYINAEAAEAFRKGVDELNAKKCSSKWVIFNSAGGQLVYGYQLGYVIRGAGFNTTVARGGECASACLVAFIGGVKREVTGNSTISFHQISRTDSDGKRICSKPGHITYASDYSTLLEYSRKMLPFESANVFVNLNRNTDCNKAKTVTIKNLKPSDIEIVTNNDGKSSMPALY